MVINTMILNEYKERLKDLRNDLRRESETKPKLKKLMRKVYIQFYSMQREQWSILVIAEAAKVQKEFKNLFEQIDRRYRNKY